MKNRILVGLIALGLAAPAFAQTSTVQEVTTRGLIMDVGGMKIDITYKPDGSLAASMDGADIGLTGKWRIDGDKLCTTTNYSPAEECAAYPTGKKSGDTFDVTGSQGTASVTIK